MTTRHKMFALTAATALTSMMLVGCQDETVVDEAQDDPVAEAAILNETVTVQSEVTEVVGPNLITVGEDDTPVTTTDVDTATLNDGDEVQVTGTVQQIQMPEEYSGEVYPAWGVAYTEDEYGYLGERRDDLGIRADELQVLSQD